MKKLTYGFAALAATALMFAGCGKQTKKIKLMDYPDTRMENVVDNYHGLEVADPYRWLEDDNSEETAEWVAAQNVVTNDYLSQIPYRDKIKKRITDLWNYPKEGVPSKHGDWYYISRNDGLQNQSVLYRQRTLDGDSEVFLDPNTLSTDGTVALASTAFSRDGRYFAYSVSVAGSDWVEIRLKDAETGADMPDVINWVKNSGASWNEASTGFYYSRYDRPEEGSMLSGQNRYQKVYYHKLGDDQSQDVLVYEDKNHPLRYFSGWESNDGKYIFIRSSEGTTGTEILFRETAKTNAPFRVLFKGFSNNYGIAYCDNDIAYVYTDENAPLYKLVSVDLKTMKQTDILPQGSSNLDGVRFTAGYIFAFYLEDAVSAVYQYDLDGELVTKIKMPELGSVGGFGGKFDATETFYSISSYTSPYTIYRYVPSTQNTEVITTAKVNFDPEQYTTTQVFFNSKDGTRVPMFIVHRNDVELNGQNPVHMYAYGGFNNSLTPGFNPSALMFVEQGGVYAVVNLRGGGEYGEEWHRAGMLESKQNVFDDFIAAGEYLIREGYTSSDKLSISGGSNGGLLVGACMTQRPDLFAVAIPQVGVLDMLRYHLFTVGWGWAVEYGSSDYPDQFEYIYAYSPLHNLRAGECYPATLITTADHDDRVVPAHSFKFAAALQKAQGCDNPTLIRIDSNAGHGAGKPTSKRIEEATDIYSFIFWNTDSKVKF